MPQQHSYSKNQTLSRNFSYGMIEPVELEFIKRTKMFPRSFMDFIDSMIYIIPMGIAAIGFSMIKYGGIFGHQLELCY
jgi:hypothetical protein